jgi:NAD+ kinase
MARLSLGFPHQLSKVRYGVRERAVTKRLIKVVGVVVKRDTPAAVATARPLVRLLKSEHKHVIAEAEVAASIGAEPVPRADLGARADLIVVLGGDGTLLGVARLVAPRGVPILGVNLGGLGFLTEVARDEASSALKEVIEGRYDVDRRIMLEAIVERAHSTERRSGPLQALNDVVLNKGPLGRMLELDVVADRKPFCSYRADGLIIATPTGSTAYALSAGGPILFPTLGAMVLAPICPHTLTNRPVVLPDTFEIEIRVTAPDHDGTLIVDGQESVPIGTADTIHVHRGRHAVVLVRSAHPYFEVWRDKLRWG